MIRGTTAQFRFKLPCTKGELEWATIKFWQNNNPSVLLPITKTLDHCGQPESSDYLYVALTAEETLRFSDRYKANVQLRARHALSGTVFSMKPYLITVYPYEDQNDPPIPDTPADGGFIILDGGEIT